MLKCEEKWDVVVYYIKKIIISKEEREMKIETIDWQAPDRCNAMKFRSGVT